MSMNVVRKQAALATRKLRVRRTVMGQTERPRLSVYRSEKHIYGQIVDDVSGRTLVAASTISRDLRDIVKELSPKDAATKVGEHLAEKAKASGVSKVVFDRGGRRYTGRVAALADGARSKGLQF